MQIDAMRALGALACNDVALTCYEAHLSVHEAFAPQT